MEEEKQAQMNKTSHRREVRICRRKTEDGKKGKAKMQALNVYLNSGFH